MTEFFLLLPLALIFVAGFVLLAVMLTLGAIAALQVGLESPEPPLELD